MVYFINILVIINKGTSLLCAQINCLIHVHVHYEGNTSEWSLPNVQWKAKDGHFAKWSIHQENVRIKLFTNIRTQSCIKWFRFVSMSLSIIFDFLIQNIFNYLRSRRAYVLLFFGGGGIGYYPTHFEIQGFRSHA